MHIAEVACNSSEAKSGGVDINRIDIEENYRRITEYADRVLKGAQKLLITRLTLAINLTGRPGNWHQSTADTPCSGRRGDRMKRRLPLMALFGHAETT
jgi:hypothetical protein